MEQLKSTFRDLPKVDGKPCPEEPNRMDVHLLDGKMVANFYRGKDLVAWGVINNPENFCNVVDAFRNSTDSLPESKNE